MNRFSLKNNRLKFKKITDHFRGIYRIYLNLIKENRRMSAYNELDLQILGSQPVMPKNLPDHCSHLSGFFKDLRFILWIPPCWHLSRFIIFNSRYILWIPLNRWVLPLWSWTSNGYFSSSCPDHTKLYVGFQLWNCWRLCLEIGVGPPLFTLLQSEILINGARSVWCDQSLDQFTCNYVAVGSPRPLLRAKCRVYHYS